MPSGGGSSQTTNTDPWSAQQPYLKTLFEQAQKNYDAGGPKYFPNNTVAPFSTAEKLGQQTALASVPAQQSIADAAAKGVNFATSGAILDPNSNPYIKAAADAAVRPIYQNLTEQVLPAIRSDAVTSGGYGGSRQGIAEGIAARGAATAEGDTRAKVYSDAYQQGLDAYSRGLALAPQTAQLQLTPGQTQIGVGQDQRLFNQDVINAAIQKWNYEQGLPSANLTDFANLIRGNYGGAVTAPGASSNPFMSTLGGAATGAAIGSVVPGIGTAIGAGGGALLGLLGGLS